MKAEIFLKSSNVDLILLDIEMPKISGLAFLQKMNLDSMAILTTAFPQYALEGYELDIIDYLLKPFAFNRFLKAVHKAKDFYEMKTRTGGAPDSSYIFIKSERELKKWKSVISSLLKVSAIM